MRPSMAAIVLATLNARYAHASLGLRYLRANLGELRERSVIREFVLGKRTDEVAEKLLAAFDGTDASNSAGTGERILGLGVYIWNVDETTRLVALLKTVAPGLVIVIGGPEVSHEVDEQPICRLADYVVTGWGDVTFAALARAVLSGPRPLMKVHAGQQPPLDELVLPYDEYSDADLAHRTVYVEASRGCPFKCEFCLSALDRTAWAFPLAPVLAALDRLYARGARHFKFVDRTFNLKVQASRAILEFFLARVEAAPDDPAFAHFELVPDHLPEALRDVVARFPSGTLQFEIGIQTFNPDVQKLVSRRQDNTAAVDNLRWLRTHTQAHLHVDLIAGLPGEDLASFAAGFDRLVALHPHEIQFGILKRLRGAPIARHSASRGMRYDPHPPYAVLATDCLDFATLQRLGRASRYWDLVANSGRFPRSLPLLLGAAPCARLIALADWLYERTGQTHALAVERLFALLREFLVTEIGLAPAEVDATLVADYAGSGARGRLAFDTGAAPGAPHACAPGGATRSTPRRQSRHTVAAVTGSNALNDQ